MSLFKIVGELNLYLCLDTLWGDLFLMCVCILIVLWRILSKSELHGWEGLSGLEILVIFLVGH